MSAEAEVLLLTQRLLDAIAAADWDVYAQLCDPTLTCFEPEAGRHLVEGMPFHQFYFDLGAAKGPRSTTIVSPHVRLMGDSAVVSYVRLTQRLNLDGQPSTSASAETRIWQRQNGQWKHVHFHRSVQGLG